MGDIYAVQVAKGQELQIKENIINYLEYYGLSGLVKAIHVFETFSRKVKEKSSKTELLMNFKSALNEGYIFIELSFSADTKKQRFPARLWHLVKSVPKVFRIIEHTVPREEFERLCNNLNVEPVVEIASEKKIEDIDEKKMLHKANTAKDPREAKEIRKKLDNLNATITPLIYKVEQVIEQAKDTSKQSINRMIEKCKAFIRRKRETFIFPMSLFLIARKSVDPEEKMNVRELREGDLILHAMIKQLQQEVLE